MVELDEPSLSQTDPALLQLKLKTLSRNIQPSGQGGDDQAGDNEEVSSDNTDGNNINNQETVISSSGTAREIDTWIENIKHLHETTARPESVTLMHTQAPPDIELLMQEWPEEVENALNIHSLPGPDLDCTLEEFVNIICGKFFGL